MSLPMAAPTRRALIFLDRCSLCGVPLHSFSSMPIKDGRYIVFALCLAHYRRMARDPHAVRAELTDRWHAVQR